MVQNKVFFNQYQNFSLNCSTKIELLELKIRFNFVFENLLHILNVKLKQIKKHFFSNNKNNK
jgi:hypothetical protein